MSSNRRSPEALLRRVRSAGPRGLTAAASRRTTEPLRARARAWRLSRNPLTVGGDELRRALGGLELADALRGSALRALPTVAAFERSLDGLDDDSRRDLLGRADAIVAHRYDLLGSGPTDLGEEIDWSADFLHGYRWPMKHSRLLPANVPGADVKMPWELSRCQHLPLLSAAFRVSGEEIYLDELGAQLTSWIEANPVEFGVNWICTMDVAIRAANWVAALVIAAPEAAARPWAERVAGSLLLHGRFIRANPEWAPIRSNHYLSDVVGLLVVSALFAAGQEGRGWHEWATGELLAEMEHEVREDGCSHEASIPYHRLVTELFLCGTQVVESTGAALPPSYSERLELMLDFVAAYTRPDGLAPQVGDNDDGRFLPLDDYARADPRSHLHLFRQAGRTPPPAPGSTAFPRGGYYVLRAGEIFLFVRCGDTGLGGQGGHAHNDQLSFELCHRGEALVEDPGAYRYAPDARLRKLFRSTSFHATLLPDGEEQNPIPEPPRFPFGDRTRAEAIEWSPDAPRPSFVGRHHGFEHLQEPVEYQRHFELDPTASRLTIVDRVAGTASHRLEWTFPLAPSHGIAAGEGRADVEFAATRMAIQAPEVDFEVVEGLYSPRYGARESRPFLCGRARSTPGEQTFRFEIQLSDRVEGGV
ncbi:MAG: alginate lyase family protein [Actinobacteria bacterium]|nr:alginate lyase family protein [Actinomycetota bacterium]